MTLYLVGRMHQNTPKHLIEEYSAKGGVVTICPEGSRTENIDYNGGFYNRKRKPSNNIEATEEPTEES